MRAAWQQGAVVLLLQLAACLPEPLDVDSLPHAPDQLVVSTQIVPDRSLVVWLTRTFGALEASGNSDPEALVDAIAVNDAVVVIEGPAGADTLAFLGNGLYGGVFVPFTPGEEYTLLVESSSLGKVSATTVVKGRVDFESANAALYDNGYGDTLVEVSYAFKDAPEKNWYMINVQEAEEDAIAENFVNPRAFTVLVADDAFNGTAYGERFRVFTDEYRAGDTVAVSLSSISEEYYEFMKLRMDNRFSLIELISEPVDYPSNVVGGRGYFNLYTPDVELFVLD